MQKIFNNSCRSLMGLFCVAILLGGCAHSINVTPSLPAIAARTTQASQQKIGFSVGYYISQTNRQLEVTTPGGGGDNVRYHPYEALELGYRDVLTSVFRNVAISSADRPGANDPFDFVIEPTVITSSGSTGFFTWPPSNFSVDITNTIRDSSGKVIGSPRVVGIGTAETGERLKEHGIAGRRAIEDALIKTHSALQQVALAKSGQKPEQHQASFNEPRPKEVSANVIEERLRRLKDLKEKGLITNKDYEVQKQSVLDLL